MWLSADLINDSTTVGQDLCQAKPKGLAVRAKSEWVCSNPERFVMDSSAYANLDVLSLSLVMAGFIKVGEI